MLADISVEYYARLERSIARGVSEDVLEGIVRAMQLDEAERAPIYSTRSRQAPPVAFSPPQPGASPPWC